MLLTVVFGQAPELYEPFVPEQVVALLVDDEHAVKTRREDRFENRGLGSVISIEMFRGHQLAK